MNTNENWGVNFSEHMGGWFAEGESDPSAGLERGRREGCRIDFRVSIKIPSLKRFVEEPDSAGVMTGKLDAGPLGKNIVINDGVFNIFPGAAGSGLRHVTYKFPFTTVDFEKFFFSGIKNIHDDRKLRKRDEPVTLFAKIYRGGSERGAPFAAGVLVFDILRDGLPFFLSFKYPGTKNMRERFAAMMALNRHTKP